MSDSYNERRRCRRLFRNLFFKILISRLMAELRRQHPSLFIHCLQGMPAPHRAGQRCTCLFQTGEHALVKHPRAFWINRAGSREVLNAAEVTDTQSDVCNYITQWSLEILRKAVKVWDDSPTTLSIEDVELGGSFPEEIRRHRVLLHQVQRGGNVKSLERQVRCGDPGFGPANACSLRLRPKQWQHSNKQRYKTCEQGRPNCPIDAACSRLPYVDHNAHSIISLSACRHSATAVTA